MITPKKILLIHGALNLGGIETHIVRLAEELSLRGVEVRVLLLTKVCDVALIKALEKYAVVYFLADILKYKNSIVKNNAQLMAVMPVSKIHILGILKDVDCVHVCGVWSLVFYCRNIVGLARTTKVVCGVYHQNEFNFSSVYPIFFRRYLIGMVQSYLPSDSMLFFNEKSVETAISLYGEKYREGNVFPIGIKFGGSEIDPSVNWKLRKIISVGRLTKFKTYNFKMIECFDEIKKIDQNFQYHIYGDGEEMTALKKLVEDRRLSGSVFFHGSIPYNKFENVIKDAFIFVGSGTAILEASSMGVPSVIGIESDNDGLTYGLLSSLSGYSYHEKNLNYALHSFPDCIKDISVLALPDYIDISDKAKSRASEFSIEKFVDLYTKFISDNLLLPIKNVKISLVPYLLGVLFCFLIGFFNKKKIFGARY